METRKASISAIGLTFLLVLGCAGLQAARYEVGPSNLLGFRLPVQAGSCYAMSWTGLNSQGLRHSHGRQNLNLSSGRSPRRACAEAGFSRQ